MAKRRLLLGNPGSTIFPNTGGQTYVGDSQPGDKGRDFIPATTAPRPAAPVAAPQDSGYSPDSGYIDALRGQMSQMSAADAAQRATNVRQALIAFGLVPEGYNDPYGDVDANTRALIGKNTASGISTYARLLEGKTDARKALINRLGGKGLFRSGSKGYGLRRGQLDFDRSLADSMAQLMQTVGGFNNQFAQNEMARQQQLANAAAQMAQSFRPSGPQVAPSLPPGTTSVYAPAFLKAMNHFRSGSMRQERLAGGGTLVRNPTTTQYTSRG